MKVRSTIIGLVSFLSLTVLGAHIETHLVQKEVGVAS